MGQPGQGRYAVVFGVSGCESWRLYDLEHGRKVLGYWPEENVSRQASSCRGAVNIRRSYSYLEVLLLARFLCIHVFEYEYKNSHSSDP